MHKTLWRWSYRIAITVLFLAGLAFAATVVALRYWILPNIGQYREDIAASITRAAGQRVAIGAIDANWERLRPHLELREVQVYDRQGRPALVLQQVDSTLSWWTLLVGEVRLHSLEISDPVLSIRRDVEGHIFIAGIELNQPDSDSGFADWLLQQPRIVIRNAVIEWRDEKRQAPALTLSRVNLRLESSGRRHQLGLQAVPPAELADPLDIRADLKGEKVAELAAWEGKVYAKLAHADIAAWQAWLPFPFELQHGYGGVQAWLGLKAGGVSEVTADVRLNDVVARFASDLPPLDLHSLSGRLGWRPLQADVRFVDSAARFIGDLAEAELQSLQGRLGGKPLLGAFEFRAQHLSLAAKSGVNLPATDLLVRYIPAQGKKPATGDIHANGLYLAPLVKLADALPLSPDVRVNLAEIGPQGNFRDFSVKWSGDWKAPLRYTAKGSFTGLGMKPHGKLPGFSGLSGNLDANEKSGTLALDSHQVRAHFPDLFHEPLEMDALTAQMNWKKQDNSNGLDINLTSLSLANRHLAGTLFGSYKMKGGTPGIIDLTGQFSRGDARQVGRYIPLTIGQSTRDWLNTALLAGQSNDVRLRLKGNLADFPFADGKRGLFEVVGKVTGGTLEYAPGWPKIENIVVDLLFRGARMEITAHQGNTDGMQINKTRAVIPDLLTWDEILEVEGEARGPTGDMIKFIDHSPVSAMIDDFTEGMGASGNGNFKLKLAIPLRRNKDSRVEGSYQFVNNRVSLGSDFPVLDQVNGRLDFTEASVAIPRITALALGGAASISGATQKDGGVRINAQGRATAAGIRGLADQPITRSMSGTTDWRGVVSIRKKQADMLLESSLVGLAVNLPVPFGKTAAEMVPLRFEKKISGANEDLIQLNYGKVLAAVLLRRQGNGKMTIERGSVNLGATAVLPPQPGIWLSGELALLDLDHWRGILGPSSDETPLPGFAGLNLKFGALDVFGKRFNDLHISAKMQEGTWQAKVVSRELAGNVQWNPEARGRLQARLDYLTIPDPAPAKLGVPTKAPQEKELPALDVVAESFSAKQKKLGKLELLAVQEDDDWRIEKLRISNPDGNLQMDGLWQGWRRRPMTNANLHVDAQDLGKLLARLGYPDAVKRGTAKLDGQLSWAGSPHDIDFPSLTGSLQLEAKNGQFLKVEPGVGKLLGLLSLQSLPRRLTLDFRDIFSGGFAFDSISGSARIDHGVAHTDDFRLEGPAAKVRMQGETDLAKETQNLKVRVAPQLGEGVSVAGAFLGGPVVGIAALVAQKLLRDPIDQIAAYEYSISGTWDKPNVVKIGGSVQKESP
ncbi:MAG: TIGR02099 family protein [Gammaproteobacteria bacterium]|nr:TIGR02099 family protein [Gammaproteobacteria bacterium]MBU1979896.1 TIGR02099 family protein [Gammaproteobacteria bacterium]